MQIFGSRFAVFSQSFSGKITYLNGNFWFAVRSFLGKFLWKNNISGWNFLVRGSQFFRKVSLEKMYNYMGFLYLFLLIKYSQIYLNIILPYKREYIYLKD